MNRYQLIKRLVTNNLENSKMKLKGLQKDNINTIHFLKKECDELSKTITSLQVCWKNNFIRDIRKNNFIVRICNFKCSFFFFFNI